jgi:hypothetical protein
MDAHQSKVWALAGTDLCGNNLSKDLNKSSRIIYFHS